MSAITYPPMGSPMAKKSDKSPGPPLTVYTINQLDLHKISQRAPETNIEWTIDDLVELTGQNRNHLRHHQTRNLWHPENFGSVVIFLARYAIDELREKLVRASVFPRPSTRTTPASLKTAVIWAAQFGSDEFKHRVLRSSMSGGGRTRVVERAGKRR